ncbi:putative lipoprotein [Ehrlichia chaffeensis str. Liberty]|uniref:TRP75-related protein n=1 Tax=Ehrlichia chaffeensis TaxID=945 RepID=UPI000444AB30|nr:TRP75-related protein [Ehrlichia chaffeensis]AHX06621.1 putative lipoprotein [Ehrlichia chaffeensis str. Liberty]
MFRRNILNVLLVLIFCFVISCSNKSRYQFSKKYSPVYNPDGEAFDSDVGFSRAYSIYKERRNALVSGIDESSKKVSVRRKVKPKVQVRDVDLLKEYGDLLKEENCDLMVDGNGVNLVDVAGAKFIDPIENDDDVIDHDNRHVDVKSSVVKTKDKNKLQDVKDNKPSDVKLPVIKAEDKSKLRDVKDNKSTDVKLPVVKAEDKNKLQDVKDNKPSDVKFPVIKAEDKSKLRDVKDNKSTDVKLPVVKAEDKNKLQDVKDNKPSDVKLPVVKAEDKNKLQDVKDNKPSDVKLPVIKAEDKNKLQDVKDNKPSDVKLPVVKAEDKSKLRDVKDNKPSDVKLPVIKAEDKSKLRDVKDNKPSDVKLPVVENMIIDTSKLNDDGDHKADKKEKGLRSLLKFTKIENDSKGYDNNVAGNIANDSEEPTFSQPKSDVESPKQVSESDEQKNSHKAVHFLSFLNEPSEDQNDTTEELQNTEDKKDNLLEENVKISEKDDQQVVISIEEENQMLLQSIKKMKEYDEDYSITYYYDDDGMAYYED